MVQDFRRRALLKGLLALALMVAAAPALAKDGDSGGGSNSGSGGGGDNSGSGGGDDDGDSDGGSGRGSDSDNGGSNSGKGNRRDQDAARAARERGDILPLAFILRAARNAVGGRALDAVLTRSSGTYQYRVKMLTSGGRYQLVWVNGRTGAVTRIKEL
jgi:hypothetical protein